MLIAFAGVTLDNVETQPIEEYDAILRAKTLELGEDSVSPGSSSDSRPKPLSRAKSHVDVQHQPGIARDGAEASLAVPAAPAEPKV